MKKILCKGIPYSQKESPTREGRESRGVYMKAVVLAGGYGTRLRPLTYSTPKAMIPLVNKPVIDYILDYLVGYGLKDIVITTNYLREQTINYLSSRKDLKLSYPEEPFPLGTAGSVKNACIDDTALIIQGDNITDINIKKMIIRCSKSRKDFSLCRIICGSYLQAKNKLNIQSHPPDNY